MHQQLEPIYRRLTNRLLGSESVAEPLLAGLLAEGHVLIEGPPGTGKTSLVKTLAESVDCSFRRIQFTPDLLPADVVGFTLYHQGTGDFVFQKGSVFGNIILADEINRSSPRVQSALLECMNEHQVSVDGVTHVLDRPFQVIATRNKLESSGTFPLPDSQLDRFLFSIDMPVPDAATQVEIVELHAAAETQTDEGPLLTREDLLALIRQARGVMVSRNVSEYIVALCEAARNHTDAKGLYSARPSIGLMQAARAIACLHEAPAVFPDHVKRIFPYVMRHRLILRGRHAHQADRMEAVLKEIVEGTPVPLGEA